MKQTNVRVEINEILNKMTKDHNPIFSLKRIAEITAILLANLETAIKNLESSTRESSIANEKLAAKVYFLNIVLAGSTFLITLSMWKVEIITAIKFFFNLIGDFYGQ